MRTCDICADAYCDYYSEAKANISADKDCVDAPPPTATSSASLAHVEYRELKGVELDEYPPENEEEDEEGEEVKTEEEVKTNAEGVKTNDETS